MRDSTTGSASTRGKEANTGRKDTYYWRNRDKILARLRQRYRDDDEYRQMVREKARRRYHEDEAYREATKRRSRERYWKMKEAQSFVEALRTQGVSGFQTLSEKSVPVRGHAEPEKAARKTASRKVTALRQSWAEREDTESE